MRFLIATLFFSLSLSGFAVDFTGPGGWSLVNTNAVKNWQESHADKSTLALRGVVADKAKREVRLLAEAVGHSGGTTTEFLMVGPGSDRAYEAAAVTVASPGDIVKAVESLGIKRGACVDSTQFRFWSFGERFQIYIRRMDVDGAEERLFSSILKDSEPDKSFLADGFVFTGGDWESVDEKSRCLTDSEAPCSVVSLYNESSSIFDLPQQLGQSQVYGRLTLVEKIPYGTLLEVILRPMNSDLKVLPLEVKAMAVDGALHLNTKCERAGVERSEAVDSAIAWMRSQTEAGKDIFVTLEFDMSLSLKQARDAANLFKILDGTGLKLYGRATKGLYYQALLPQESWRKREGRNPQPFEVTITRETSGALKKKLVFIEEDWSGEGLDPKLTPKEYPFEDWSELEPLVIKVGGADNKVAVLFFFVPSDMKLSEFMPGVNALSKRLPLVHVFADPSIQ
jgi:hypothetical protein